MKITHVALFSLLLSFLPSPTLSADDWPIHHLSMTTRDYAVLCAAATALITPRIQVCIGLFTTLTANIIDDIATAKTERMGLEENRLLSKKWHKTGFCVCIFRRLIATVFSNMVREQIVSIFSALENADMSKLLSNVSRSSAAYLFIIKHLAHKKGLLTSSLAYLKKWKAMARLETRQAAPMA